MYASGPDIQRSEVIEEMEQVDHYNVFCHLLGIEPKPNNGSMSIAKRILRKFDDVDEDDDKSESKEDSKEDDDDDDKDDDDDDDDDNSVAALQFCWQILAPLVIISFLLVHV